jgi:tRNA-(MS[2]IO[6]A)-hydroxylase (MiaE)-like
VTESLPHQDVAPGLEAAPSPDAMPGRDAMRGHDADARPGRDARPGQDGVLDLLGLLAYAELIAFFRLSDDAALAPSIADKAALGEMAVAEFGRFRLLCGQISRMDAQPDRAMQPFVAALDAFHARTAPADWLEGLVKAYVGDGIAADFYRAVAELVDPQTRALVLDVLADTGHAEFVIARVRAAIEADPQVAGRLALWARRLVGEALAQAYRVAAERAPLARLLAGGQGRSGERAVGELGEIGRMFARITDTHAQRMAALGLADWESAPDEG